MTPATARLLTELREAGARLAVQSGQLVLDAPRGVLNSETLARLRDAKAEIVRSMEGPGESGQKGETPLNPEENGTFAESDTFGNAFSAKVALVESLTAPRELPIRDALADCIDAGGLAEVWLSEPDGNPRRIVGEPAAVEAAIREHLASAEFRRRTEFYRSQQAADDLAWLSRPVGEPCGRCGRRSGHWPTCDRDALTMPLGQHKGKRLDALPSDYLRWAQRTMDQLDSETREAIRVVLDSRCKEGRR